MSRGLKPSIGTNTHDWYWYGCTSQPWLNLGKLCGIGGALLTVQIHFAVVQQQVAVVLEPPQLIAGTQDLLSLVLVQVDELQHRPEVPADLEQRQQLGVLGAAFDGVQLDAGGRPVGRQRPGAAEQEGVGAGDPARLAGFDQELVARDKGGFEQHGHQLPTVGSDLHPGEVPARVVEGFGSWQFSIIPYKASVPLWPRHTKGPVHSCGFLFFKSPK